MWSRRSGCGEGRAPDRRRGGVCIFTGAGTATTTTAVIASAGRPRACIDCSTLSRAVHTPRGLSLFFRVVPTGARSSLAGVALRRPPTSFLPSHRTRSSAAANPHSARSESTVSVESPGPRRRTVTRCDGVRSNLRRNTIL